MNFREILPYLEHVGAIGAVAWAVTEYVFLRRRHKENEQLREAKDRLHQEVESLINQESAESIKLVEKILLKIDPPVCAICIELLFLRVATTFSEAGKRLKALVDGIIARPNDMNLVLEVLEKACQLALWQPALQSPNNPDSDRPKPQEEIVVQAMKAYVRLIPHMWEGEKERAINFCVACCGKKSPTLTVLRREAVRNLLPRLLVASDGDRKLIRAYKELFDDLRGLASEDHKTLLVAVFGGLEVAIKVKSKEDKDENAPKVRNIWEEAFNVTIEKGNIDWAWEGAGAKIGILWQYSMVERLSREPDEKEFLRRIVARHLNTKEAPLKPLSYRQLGPFVGYIRGKGVRGLQRAVVLTDIPVEIVIAEDLSFFSAKLINFSLDDSKAPPTPGGAWAKAEYDKTWAERTETDPLRSATVTISYPPENRIVFKEAAVRGPLRQGPDNDPFWGFRIELGPTSPPESIWPLMSQWDDWPKR